MHFDRFDICEAYWCHAVAWNGSLKSARIFLYSDFAEGFGLNMTDEEAAQ